jgi:hypothetical protein
MVPLEVTHTALAGPAVLERMFYKGAAVSISPFKALVELLLTFFQTTYRCAVCWAGWGDARSSTSGAAGRNTASGLSFDAVRFIQAAALLPYGLYVCFRVPCATGRIAGTDFAAHARPGWAATVC